MKYRKNKNALSSGYVAPLVGAWIEIYCRPNVPRYILSLPSWERGLKSSAGASGTTSRSSLSSWSVDWNLRTGTACHAPTMSLLSCPFVEFVDSFRFFILAFLAGSFFEASSWAGRCLVSIVKFVDGICSDLLPGV